MKIQGAFRAQAGFGVVMISLSSISVFGQVLNLENPGFGDDFSGDVVGFTGNVPGWVDIGVNEQSGVRDINNLSLNPTPPLAYVAAGDAGARQMTGHVMTFGETYRLSWQAVAIPTTVTETSQLVSLIREDSGGTITFLNTSSAPITTTPTEFAIEYFAGPGDNGSVLGVQFGPGTTPNGVVGYDNFGLAVVPEPATWAWLTGLGLAAFTAVRQKYCDRT